MLYTEFLKKKRPCPFCDPSQRVFTQRQTAYLTYSLAPYAKYHLLVIPKQHDKNFPDLSVREWKDIRALLALGVKVLAKKGITDYTILVRNGIDNAKSVEHLHFHLVPKHRIGDLDENGDLRHVLTPKGIAALTAEVSELLKK